MKFFIDTAEINDIKEMSALGVLDGVTTNPSLIMKSGRDLYEVLKDICGIVKGPVSAEVVATDYDQMIREAEKLASVASNICIKLPITYDGLKACKYLSNKGIKINMTLCFSVSQAILCTKAGATFVSPFIGRLDDISQRGMQLVEDICQVFKNYPEFKTEVLVASIRNPMHLVQSAKMGADIATIPPKVLKQLIKHPLTDVGLEKFLADWKKTGQDI